MTLSEKNQALVNEILEETAPLAAEKLRSAVRTGEGQKPDKSLQASLKVLAITGYGEQSKQVIEHNHQPAIGEEFLAGVLTIMGKMVGLSKEEMHVDGPKDVTQSVVPQKAQVPADTLSLNKAIKYHEAHEDVKPPKEARNPTPRPPKEPPATSLSKDLLSKYKDV